MVRIKSMPRIPIELALKLQRRPDGSRRLWKEVASILKDKHDMPPAPHAPFSRATLASAAFHYRQQHRRPGYNVLPE